MKCGLLIIIFFSISSISFSQHRFHSDSDSLHMGRFIGVTSAISGVWGASIVGLSQVWYKDIEKTSWHTFDDFRNWLQMDKAGHFYAAYKINHLTTNLYTWSGLDQKKSLWIGTGISTGYQLTLEFFDAYSAEWGFSWSDIAANTLGSFSYFGQQRVWGEERIIPKFSYSPSPFASVRPSVLGGSFAESLLKDYNGQTYWLSFSPGTFWKNSSIPEWACFSLGYSAHAKLKGDEEFYFDILSETGYVAQREFIFSLDIDFSRLPIKRPWLKKVVQQFNYLKVPFPALVLRGSDVFGKGIYF